MRIPFPGSMYDDGINIYSDADILPDAAATTRAATQQIFRYPVKLPDGRQIILRSSTELSKEKIQAEAQKFINKKLPRTNVGAGSILIKNTNDPHVQNFLNTFKLTDQMKSRMIELGDNLELVKDPTIKQYIEKKLDTLAQNRKCSVTDMEEMEMLVDAANEYSGQYSHLRNIGIKGDLREFSNMSNFNKYLKSQENLATDELLNNEVLPAQFVQKGSISLKSDLKKETQLYSMRQYMKNYPDSAMSNHLYDQYINKVKTNNPAAMEKLSDLNQKYNVKVFIPARYSKSKCDQILDYLDKEFAQWQKASNGTAKLPPVVDFSAAKTNWYDKTSAYGQSASNAYSEPTYKGSLAFSYFDVTTLQTSLRHEMTHTNDLKHGKNIPAKYNLNEIMPKKAVEKNGRTVMVPDFENCKFKEEFRNAGLPEERIQYAYNNPMEFIARASEGDMSKYSPEFKEMLKDFGMPEWMFNMAPRG